jgi:hypothetical protein
MRLQNGKRSADLEHQLMGAVNIALGVDPLVKVAIAATLGYIKSYYS